MNSKTFFAVLLFITTASYSNPPSVKDLHFLIGTWQVEENNTEKNWWEKCTRTGTYILDSTYIQLESVAISSIGKKRTYRFMIHFDKTVNQFEMICMYGNWSKIQTDLLVWDREKRILTIRNKPQEGEYVERIGVMQFSADFNSYIWKGTNKSGDREKPNIWEFEEKGIRVNR